MLMILSTTHIYQSVVPNAHSLQPVAARNAVEDRLRLVLLSSTFFWVRGVFLSLLPVVLSVAWSRSTPRTTNLEPNRRHKTNIFLDILFFFKIRFYKIGTLSTSILCGVVFDTVWNRGCDAERQFFLTCAVRVKTWHNVFRKCSKSVRMFE